MFPCEALRLPKSNPVEIRDTCEHDWTLLQQLWLHLRSQGVSHAIMAAIRTFALRGWRTRDGTRQLTFSKAGILKLGAWSWGWELGSMAQIAG